MTAPADIARLRRFNRAVTTEVGALDQSFLGRGRPLGAARVLCALAPEGTEVTDLRDRMALDAGLLSRLLKGLEAEGLLRVTASEGDARRRRAIPTARGRAEIAAYDRLSDDRAAALLAAQGRGAARLLDAMDTVALALNRDRITLAEADPRDPRALDCLAGYYADLAARFETGFDPALGPDPEADDLRAPRGGFLLALSDGAAVGCAALRGDGGPAGEVKRVWIAPAARGLGLARRLMNAVEDLAAQRGMTRLRLDTNRTLTEAITLYRALGYREIPAFNANPYAHHWFEKTLGPPPKPQAR